MEPSTCRFLTLCLLFGEIILLNASTTTPSPSVPPPPPRKVRVSSSKSSVNENTSFSTKDNQKLGDTSEQNNSLTKLVRKPEVPARSSIFPPPRNHHSFTASVLAVNLDGNKGGSSEKPLQSLSISANNSVRRPPPPPPPKSGSRNAQIEPPARVRPSLSQQTRQQTEWLDQSHSRPLPPAPRLQQKPGLNPPGHQGDPAISAPRRVPPAQHAPRPHPPSQHQNHPGTLQMVPHQPQRARQVPAWKRMWHGIERGLDNLADFEASVTDRAAKLVSDVKVPDRVSHPINNMWGRRRAPPAPPVQTPVGRSVVNEPNRRQDGIESLIARKMSAARFDKKDATPTPTDNKAVNLASYNPNTGGNNFNSETSRIMKAKGGAASTHGVENESQSTSPGASSWGVTSSGRPIPSKPSDDTVGGRPDPRQVLLSTPPGNQSPASRPPETTPPSFEDDEKSQMSLSAKIVSSLPRFPSLRFRLGRKNFGAYSAAADLWDDEEDDKPRGGFRLWGRTRSDSPQKSPSSLPNRVKWSGKAKRPPIDNFLRRCDSGKSLSLLTERDSHQASSVGRSQAILDISSLALVLCGVRILLDLYLVAIPPDQTDVFKVTLKSVLEVFSAAQWTWAPFALAAAFLLQRTSSLVYGNRLNALSESIETEVHGEADYGSLFLRLYGSGTPSSRLPEVSGVAAMYQSLAAAAKTRSSFFLGCLMASLVISSFPALFPLFTAVLSSSKSFMSSNALRVWPPEWSPMWEALTTAFGGLGATFVALAKESTRAALEDPLQAAFKISILLALCMVAFLPSLESRRRVHSVQLLDEDEIEVNSHKRLGDHLVDYGSSGASRLGLISVDHSIETLLERWRASSPPAARVLSGLSARYFGRLVMYGCLAALALVAPLAVYGSTGFSTSGSGSSLIRWDGLVEVVVVILFAFKASLNSLSDLVRAEDMKQYVSGYIQSLASAVESRDSALADGTTDLQIQASISSSAGISVKDLWAAHTTRRAWAVRGAGFSCGSGEVVAVLGESGSGKTRLLTTVAESILGIPKNSLSATRVRGTVSVGGVDVSKWDSVQLRKRLGLMLSDVRMVSDAARLASGLTLEEILAPSDGTHVSDPAYTPGPNERSCVLLALKITGLYSSLLPKLPSKMSSVVTCREDDLKPSPLRPRYSVLSPTEWSKLVLAKVLAQTIYDNESSAGHNDAIEQSLMGSVLLLDDAAVHLSEVDEARMIGELRKTGAASVITSKRWSTGRFADRIVVVKEGAVVESGTHEELLSRGPQQSLYAAKWHAMTTYT